MADIDISRPHGMTLKQAKQAAQQVADDMARDYGVSSAWAGDTLNFSRAGVSGVLVVDAVQMQVQLQLGFLFKPFAGQVREQLEANFDKLLARQAAKK